jgi:phage terminase large subunit-like protein
MGWVNADARWRFRSAWIETGKGQAKSPLMAGLGLYAMGWCGFERSQVYSIAANKQTANVLFKDAWRCAARQVPGYGEDESLEELGHVVSAASSTTPGRSSTRRAGVLPAAGRRRASSRVRGRGWSWPTRSTNSRPTARSRPGARDRQGRRQRDDGAGHQHAGDVADRRHELFGHVPGIAKGEIKDDSAFAFVARVDKADRETVFEKEACWAKALPALGVTLPLIANIREEVQTARTRLSTASSVKRLYFGIPTGAADFWIDEESWAAVLGSIDDKLLRFAAASAGCRWISRRRTTSRP